MLEDGSAPTHRWLRLNLENQLLDTFRSGCYPHVRYRIAAAAPPVSKPYSACVSPIKRMPSRNLTIAELIEITSGLAHVLGDMYCQRPRLATLGPPLTIDPQSYG